MSQNIRLNSLILSFFILIAFVVALGLITQYKFSKKMTVNSYVHSYNSQAMDARESFRLYFDQVLYRFKSKENENIEKLNLLYDEYKQRDGNLDNEKLVKELNKNSPRREYEFLLINRDYIIEKGSYTPDVGLDLGQFEGVSEILQSVFEKKVSIDIASPKIDTSSMSIKRYLIKLSHDEKYLLQIAYEIPIYEKLKNIRETFLSEDNSIKVFSAQPFMIHDINFNTKPYIKTSFDDTWQSTKEFLENITKHDEKENKRINELIKANEKKRSVDVYKELVKIFTNDTSIISVLDLEENQMLCSFIANGVFSESDDVKFLVQITYNTDDLHKDLDKSFYLLITILAITMLILFFIYIFNLSNVSNKLISIVRNINKNRSSNEKDIRIYEIQNLNDSYNKLHEQLNKELSINKKLLSDNKRFIADTVHQIRTPLSNIMMNSDMIKIFKKDNSFDEFTEQIDASINMLTNSYEDLSYITSYDLIKYSAVELNLSDVLRDRTSFFETISKVNNKKITSEIEENIIIKMNLIELERLIDNNISNAVKYGEVNKEIEIKLYKDTNYIVLSISSYGDAIQNPQKVFDKGYRENEAKRGLGLGLNMVKGICEKYMITYSVTYKNGKNIFSYIWHI